MAGLIIISILEYKINNMSNNAKKQTLKQETASRIQLADGTIHSSSNEIRVHESSAEDVLSAMVSTKIQVVELTNKQGKTKWVCNVHTSQNTLQIYQIAKLLERVYNSAAKENVVIEIISQTKLPF